MFLSVLLLSIYCFLIQLCNLIYFCFKVCITSPCIDPPVVISPGTETVFTVSNELVLFCAFVTPSVAAEDPGEKVYKNPPNFKHPVFFTCGI